MKKRILSIGLATMSVAMFGILYPEYIFVPGTYEYIMEESLQRKDDIETESYAELSVLLNAKPEQIQVSSKFMEFLAEEGILEWKK